MTEVGFPTASVERLRDERLRVNLDRATRTIRARRAEAVGEVDDWEELREAGRALKQETLERLDLHLLELERNVTRTGGRVHWAPDGATANEIVTRLARDHGATRLLKAKSITTDEIGLNDHLAREGIEAIETDLAELIVQLAHEKPSHILVPAIHKNRGEIRDLFREQLGLPELTDEPSELAGAARSYLRELFLEASVGVCGANFAVAETGHVCLVESEGNGRMVTTLPRVLVAVVGIEKVVARWQDLEVFLQLLPRSATGERMNPYTSFWAGVSENDGPREFHLVLLDNGRSDVLSDAVGRPTLACIRCSACLNVCPVYTRVGGHAYESVYPGPIGAILTPQLRKLESARSLPYASSLCGACYDVCPVKIDIPAILVHLRGRVVSGPEGGRPPLGERVSMRLLGWIFASRRRYETAQRLGRLLARLRAPGLLARLPGPARAWSADRDLPQIARQSFRDWWRERER